MAEIGWLGDVGRSSHTSVEIVSLGQIIRAFFDSREGWVRRDRGFVIMSDAEERLTVIAESHGSTCRNRPYGGAHSAEWVNRLTYPVCQRFAVRKLPNMGLCKVFVKRAAIWLGAGIKPIDDIVEVIAIASQRIDHDLTHQPNAALGPLVVSGQFKRRIDRVASHIARMMQELNVRNWVDNGLAAFGVGRHESCHCNEGAG